MGFVFGEVDVTNFPETQNVNLATRLSSDIDSISLEGRVATYGGITGYAVPASGDTFEISGSATKTIKVWQVSIVAYATSAGTQLVLLRKRSTANTGGTATNVGRIPFDSADAASASDVRLKAYNTAAPTPGTEVGIIEGQTLFCPSSATPAFAPVPYIINFAQSGRKPIVLRGVAESLVVNTFSILAGLNLTIGMVWTEE